MPLEIEIKYPGVDLAALRRRLLDMGAHSRGMVIERNVVFDTPGRALLGARCLLRLRWCENGTGDSDQALLTYKRPAPDDGVDGCKRQEEIETDLTNGDAMRTILATLGYEAAFSYDKTREICLLDNVAVCLDRLPFGDEDAPLYEVAELEGDEDAIRALAVRLELPAASASAANYHDLHRQWRAEHGLAPREDFAFSARALERLRQEFARGEA